MCVGGRRGTLNRYLINGALGVVSCGVWMVSLHKFCELLCAVGYRGVFCVLIVEPIVSLGGIGEWVKLLLPMGDVLLFC